MVSSKFNVSAALKNYEDLIVRKMTMEFERQMNRIINEYQDKLRETLVDIATGYAVCLHDEIDDYGNERKLTVEVKWPNETTEDSDEGVG